MRKIILLIAALSAIGSSAWADPIYTNSFLTGSGEPPSGWDMFYTSAPASMSAVTFTAAANVGYMALTATTNSQSKSSFWRLSAGGNIGTNTMYFTVVDMASDTNTSFTWGPRSLGSNPTSDSAYFRLAQTSGHWIITPAGFLNTSSILVNALSPGDIVMTSIGSESNPIVTLKINTFTAYSGARDSVTTNNVGSPFIGITRVKYGFSFAKISNLIIVGMELTSTATPTHTCTTSPTPTKTFTPTPRRTASPSQTPTVTRSPTATPTATRTITITRTVTKTPTATRTPSHVQAGPGSTHSSNW